MFFLKKKILSMKWFNFLIAMFNDNSKSCQLNWNKKE